MTRDQGCCSPLGKEILSAAEAATLSGRLKVLADPARLRIVSMLAAAGGEACICELTGPLGLAQPTVSHHMKLLHRAGFVTSDRRGRWVFYRVVPEALDSVRGALSVAQAV